MSGRVRALIHAALLAAVALACYAHTLGYPFHFDDGMFILENPLVTKPGALLNPDGILADPTLSDSVTGSRITRWIGYASFRMNYLLGGLDTRGYHAVNIALHLVCGLLVYAIVLMSLRLSAGGAEDGVHERIALFAAAVFIAHPLQTQAVTYITQRFASLAAMFCLSSMACYIRWRTGGRGAWLALAVGASAAAMLTKENSFVLPVAIALLEFAFFRSRGRRQYLALGLVAATMLIVPAAVLYSSSGGAVEATAIHKEISRFEYLLTQFAVIATYMRMLALPYGLNLDHDFPLYGSLASPAALGSLALLALIAAAAVRGYMRAARGALQGGWAMIHLGALLAFVFLSVESSVVVLANLIFEHRMYLPMLGVVMAAAGGAASLAQSHARRRSRLVIAALCIVVALCATSRERNKAWQSEIALWSDAAAKSPLKPRPHTSLAKAYAEAGMHEEAEAEYKRAIALDPAHNVDVRPEAMYNLAILYRETGRVAEAEGMYVEMLRLYPGAQASLRAMALYNLGNLYLGDGRVDDAAGQWELAVSAVPSHSKAHNQLGNYYSMRADVASAEEHYRVAIAANPSNHEARLNYARLLESAGRADEARAVRDEAARLRTGL